MSADSRPKVAVIATTYFAGSHADVIVTRLLEGYEFAGSETTPRIEVASLYLEQLGTHHDPGPRPDLGIELSDRHGITRYPTVAEAIGCGRPGVNVDGVLIIGEHGDYPLNEYGQKLYPRRRLFDSAVAAMIGAGRTVPIFNDKHLAWSYTDARYMVDTAARLGIPLLAGSTVPLTWRIPTGAQWPADQPMDAAVLIGYGPREMYGFHNLEALQVNAERRAGAETGVRSVRALAGERAQQSISDGTVDAGLFDQALATFELDSAARSRARSSVREVFIIDYLDGLRAAVVNCTAEIANFGFAGRGPGFEAGWQLWLPGAPHAHFVLLIRQIESLILNGAAPYPIERTLLTTGLLDAAMRCLHEGQDIERDTPELKISYRAVTKLADTGIESPAPR